MPGDSDLQVILKTIKPVLNEGEFVFCHVPENHYVALSDIICVFREKEGITIVVSREIADRFNLAYSYISAWITLTVHSSLESVGLTAAFSTALANAGISCNVVAAYYHDHIFVNIKDAQRAMQVLESISSSF
jgi:hypothetical protein